jgi:hypothetical protein
MTTKFTFHHFFWPVLLAFLTACGATPTHPPASTTATPIDEAAISTPATAYAQLTKTAVNLSPTPLPPTPTALPMGTPLPTETPSPTLPPFPQVTVDGLRVAYIIDGNLYVQDSGGQPVQLTSSGKDSQPIFSDDGQKLIFRREEDLDVPEKGWSFNIYSINADGTHEQLLVNASKLMAFGANYDDFSEAAYLEFAPGTHRLLFNTRQTTGYRLPSEHDQPNKDLFSLNADSGEMKRFFPGGDFGIAPKGNLAWVSTPAGRIHIINLNGKIIQESAAEYPADWPVWIRPAIQWSVDAKRLIVIPMTDPRDDSQGRTIWRYTLGNTQKATRFDLPFSDKGRSVLSYDISPDGNWVLYYYIDRESDDTTQNGTYLGDLRTGITRLIGKAELYGTFPSWYSWSPDSVHFIYNDLNNGLYVADIHGKFTPLKTDIFDGWLDANHYLYRIRGNVGMGEVGSDAKFTFIRFPGKKIGVWGTFIFLKP